LPLAVLLVTVKYMNYSIIEYNIEYVSGLNLSHSGDRLQGGLTLSVLLATAKYMNYTIILT